MSIAWPDLSVQFCVALTKEKWVQSQSAAQAPQHAMVLLAVCDWTTGDVESCFLEIVHWELGLGPGGLGEGPGVGPGLGGLGGLGGRGPGPTMEAVYFLPPESSMLLLLTNE